jgi:NAD(P)-dependent dehydrogenase (short-subunit alcohol dehydrogenase family)
VLVNDLGGALDGSGGSVGAAQAVVNEIVAAGGEALANGASVTDFDAVQAMVQQAVDAWGRWTSWSTTPASCATRALPRWTWRFPPGDRSAPDGRRQLLQGRVAQMQAQNYGRIVMTTSSSGLYGNFGQSNYGAAKLAQVGLMQTLAIEGAKYGIHVNALAPTAATRMTQGLLGKRRCWR